MNVVVFQGNKKGPLGRWDFDTQEEYSDYMNNKEALPKYVRFIHPSAVTHIQSECSFVLTVKFVPAGLPSSMASRCPRAGRLDASKRPMRRQNWTDSGRRSAR